MKTVIRKRHRLAMVIFFGALAVLALAKQTASTASVSEAPPNEQEAADSVRLIEALNANNSATALEILRARGVAADRIQGMTTELDRTPAQIPLKESFLKAGVALSQAGLMTNAQARLETSTSLGFQRPVLTVRWLEGNWLERSDRELGQCPVAPIAVLNVSVDDPRFIRFFQWYDRYADRLHSVVLNGENLNNAKFAEGYDRANRTLNALFRLIKARKPDAFVWLTVIKEDDRSDERWLRAMTFKPDGLQISNLRQFHSPFVETRRRYIGILGADLPMMVAGFYGQKAALEEKGKALFTAKKMDNPRARQPAETSAAAQLGGVGVTFAQDFAQLEARLQSSGYRGLSVHWLLLEALANQTNAAPVEKADMIDPRAAQLDTYYAARDFKSMSAATATMLAESKPGDLNWTVAKFYDGIILLSQTPPDVKKGNAVLDEVLAFDFKGRPGRDHYILGAVKWRIHGALLSGDLKKAQQLVETVQATEFREDLKASFLKHEESLLAVPNNSAK